MSWRPLGAMLEDLFADVFSGCEELPESEQRERFYRRYAPAVAEVRRAHYRQARMVPVPVNGSTTRGLDQGYFATRLGDGTLGYLQRRTDDCLQAALASLLQVPMPDVPDLHQLKQIVSGTAPEETHRRGHERLERWLAQAGLRLVCDDELPERSERWIALAVSGASSFADHCLIMSRDECIFDPNRIVPPRKGEYATDLDLSAIAYGITAERR